MSFRQKTAFSLDSLHFLRYINPRAMKTDHHDIEEKKNRRQGVFFSHPEAQQNGVLVLYKPKGMSSAAALAVIKRGFTQKKIGHAGTLDPMAEGVLLALLGQATKLSGHLMGAGTKIYSGSILLGVETDTWDMEGEVVAQVTPEQVVEQVTEEAVRAAMAELVGTYEQEVPAYSAAKHQGKPLYALAREGLATPVKKKTVTIFSGQVESVDLPHVRFRVECSSGTYIRSLAHSLGKRLGCGAALEILIREHSYPFGLEKAVHLGELEENPELFKQKLCSIAEALPTWIRVVLTKAEAERAKNGNPVPFRKTDEVSSFTAGESVLLELDDGTPVALAETAVSQGEEVWAIVRGLWNKQG